MVASVGQCANCWIGAVFQPFGMTGSTTISRVVGFIARRTDPRINAASASAQSWPT